jgi:hypothetical protein
MEIRFLMEDEFIFRPKKMARELMSGAAPEKAAGPPTGARSQGTERT